MTNPWDGPRHRSWASNTMLTFFMLVICITATVVSDVFGEPPNYLVALLGTAAGAFFAAIGSDKQKKDEDVRHTAVDAERRASEVERRLQDSDTRADAAERRADDAEERESGWSRHRDHDDDPDRPPHRTRGGGDGR